MTFCPMIRIFPIFLLLPIIAADSFPKSPLWPNELTSKYWKDNKSTGLKIKARTKRVRGMAKALDAAQEAKLLINVTKYSIPREELKKIILQRDVKVKIKVLQEQWKKNYAEFQIKMAQLDAKIIQYRSVIGKGRAFNESRALIRLMDDKRTNYMREMRSFNRTALKYLDASILEEWAIVTGQKYVVIAEKNMDLIEKFQVVVHDVKNWRSRRIQSNVIRSIGAAVAKLVATKKISRKVWQLWRECGADSWQPIADYEVSERFQQLSKLIETTRRELKIKDRDMD